MEKMILNALDNAMQLALSPIEYSIGYESEDNICLIHKSNGWAVLLFNRGKENIIGLYQDLLPACYAFIEEAGCGEKEAEVKNKFIHNLFAPTNRPLYAEG